LLLAVLWMIADAWQNRRVTWKSKRIRHSRTQR
jgi:hypothetical protein